VFIGENDRYDGRPLGEIVQRARASEPARCCTRLDLPIVIVVVDVAERIEAFLPVLDELVTEGLVVTETVDVVKYAGRRSD
jgi:PII-like signaling protein